MKKALRFTIFVSVMFVLLTQLGAYAQLVGSAPLHRPPAMRGQRRWLQA